MRILYVCNGNSFRSPAAEALTRKHHPSWEVESAGIRIAGRIADNTKQFLKENNARKYVKPSPDQLTQRAVDQADVIIAMEEDQENFIKNNFHLKDQKIKVWNIEDPITHRTTPKKAFDKIKERVKNLNENK